MSSFKIRRNRSCNCWAHLVFQLMFFSTIKFKGILGWQTIKVILVISGTKISCHREKGVLVLYLFFFVSIKYLSLSIPSEWFNNLLLVKATFRLSLTSFLFTSLKRSSNFIQHWKFQVENSKHIFGSLYSISKKASVH